jgi:hypothetical protein
VGIGAVLVQEGRPIAFMSRTLTSPERSYSTKEKECLANCWAIGTFHPYVHGATLTLCTDHLALKSILANKAHKGRIARWIMLLQSYDYTVLHRKGIHNQDADALSRIQSINVQDTLALTLHNFRSAQKNDPFTLNIIKAGAQHPFRLKDSILYHGEPPVIVMPKSLYTATLQPLHDHPTAGISDATGLSNAHEKPAGGH